jgi:hypothetical protein
MERVTEGIQFSWKKFREKGKVNVDKGTKEGECRTMIFVDA